MKKTQIALINLGCSKNLVDSEIMLGLLSQAGYEVGLDDINADLIIINTCSFIKEAEKESVKAIMSQVANNKKIIIVGCLAQKYNKELLEIIPEVSSIVGTSDIGNIVKIVQKTLSDTTKHYNYVSSDLNYLQTSDIQRFHITMGPYSYIKISEGCNWRCTYCLIPDLKGPYRSRKIEDIVNEAVEISRTGVTEIILIAQDTTSYGIDIYNKPSLVELLKKLEQIKDIEWIRLLYTYPRYINDDLIDYISNSKKVVKYLDIPLQHSHPDILKSMHRPNINIELLMTKLRNKIDDIAIRTCFIVGFPGETEEHFNHLREFVKNQKFERLGVFEYSKEKNTPAAKLPDQIKAKIKKHRKKTLMMLQQEISLKKHQNLINKKIHVLLEKVSDSASGVGRSYMDAPEIDGLVYVNNVSGYLPGDIIPVKITKVTAYDLYGITQD